MLQLTKRVRAAVTLFFVSGIATTMGTTTPIASAQTRTSQTAPAITTQAGDTSARPATAARPFVVLNRQSLADLERRLRPNKIEDVIGGEGMQLRVAVQSDADKPAGDAEVHDRADDVFYILEGSATLTLGGTLDAPHEVSPGEWRSKVIKGGRAVEVTKGDLIVVPRGTPHSRSTAGREFSMILIKVFAESLRTTATTTTPVKSNTHRP